jgi:hypothetical protein
MPRIIYVLIIALQCVLLFTGIFSCALQGEKEYQKARELLASQGCANAEQSLNALVNKYPDSVYADKARADLQNCRQALIKEKIRFFGEVLDRVSQARERGTLVDLDYAFTLFDKIRPMISEGDIPTPLIERYETELTSVIEEIAIAQVQAKKLMAARKKMTRREGVTSYQPHPKSKKIPQPPKPLAPQPSPQPTPEKKK